MKLGLAIIFIECESDTNDYGSTFEELLELVRGYDKAKVVKKRGNNGAPSVAVACAETGYVVDHIRVCGINTEACVMATAIGLREVFPQCCVAVVEDACNGALSRRTQVLKFFQDVDGVAVHLQMALKEEGAQPMFLALELLPGKTVMLVAHDLKGDEKFNPCDGTGKSAQRYQVDHVVNQVNVDMGDGSRFSKAFGCLFNQLSAPGVTGWEYWSDKYALVLKHALLVAAQLDVPLHVDMRCLNHVLAAAAQSSISFEYDFAAPLAQINSGSSEYLNKQIANGDYVVLTNVAFGKKT